MSVSPAAEKTAGVRYAIFGCGSYGFNILRELHAESDAVVIVDIDENRVHELRAQNLEAVQGDLADPRLLQGLPPFSIAFILSPDHRANVTGLQTIHAAFPGARVVVRAGDPREAAAIEAAGADLVLYPQQMVAHAAITRIATIHAKRISQELAALLATFEGTLGIVTHNNPDPDAISSALALATIATSVNPHGLKCRILYDGVIGHQENRTMVNLLDIRMERLTPQVLQECSHLALVDSPAPGINNSLIPSARVDIILDHHRDGKYSGSGAVFADIRARIGATASILTQYLQELDIPVDRRVATGLLYGIRSDTREFRRNVTPEDLNNAAFLLPLTDPDLLDKIMSPSLSQETLDVLGIAIRSRKIRSGYLISNVGYVRNRDTLPQAADLLITLEGVNTALVYGITDEAIIMSARNRDVRLNIGNVMHEAFGSIGDAGGHPNMAAVSIPLTLFSCVQNKDELLDLVIDPILSRFSTLVGLENGGKDEI